MEIKVSGITQGLDAVGRYQGFTIFVPGGVPGDVVKAEVKTVKKNYARAAILEVITPSPDRVKPRCPLFPRCGGCQWQMIRYGAQLEFKRKIVVDALERIGGFGQRRHMPPVREVIPSKTEWFYRTKAQVPVGPAERRRADERQTSGQDRSSRVRRRQDGPGWGNKRDRVPEDRRGRPATAFVAGFYAPGTHDIVDMEECGIQHPISTRAIQVARRVAGDWGLVPYDEATGGGFLRHIVTRVAPSTGQALVVLVTARAAFRQGEAIAREIMSRFEAVRSVSQNVNTERTNAILGPRTRLLAGASRIEEVLGGLTFEISPTSFFQVNPPMAEVLYEKACEYADLKPGDTAIDAYCGIGAITLFLARGGAQVIGIEESREAVRDALRNAARNGLQNVLFEAGAVEDVLAKTGLYAVAKPRVIVVDPPRTGCTERALQAFIELAPRSIVYVSCYPATLARDLRYIADHGYHPVEVTPMDLFPQTGHVEVVCCLKKV